MIPLLTSVLATILVSASTQAPTPPLTNDLASKLATLALRCVHREFPNKPDHVMGDEQDIRAPKAMHPAFYGCYDWHSSVHGHWMLARLLKTHPTLPAAGDIRAALSESLSAENIQGEVAYLVGPNRKSFERTYGWAWLLKLSEVLQGWDDADAKKWSKNLAPLAEALAQRYVDFLPKQNYPIRTGVHPNTAFGLSFALDYARKAGNTALEQLVVERSRTYFEHDVNYPLVLEPGGEDFFSAALQEADLMRRVLPAAVYVKWVDKFFGGFNEAHLKNILTPAVVLDRSDPKLVHLDGLNLSRAWCLRSIAQVLPPKSKGHKIFAAAAEKHAQTGLPFVTSGNYEGEHWLASFAVYLLTQKIE